MAFAVLFCQDYFFSAFVDLERSIGLAECLVAMSRFDSIGKVVVGHGMECNNLS